MLAMLNVKSSTEDDIPFPLVWRNPKNKYLFRKPAGMTQEQHSRSAYERLLVHDLAWPKLTLRTIMHNPEKHIGHGASTVL